jgi:hypothetical protein
MIPLKDKDEDWKKDCMDALETIAQSQRNSNLKLLENYEMIKGKFFFSHYIDDAGTDGMLGKLSKEFELPGYLKHYDIISPVVNTLLGEWEKLPDTFRVKDWSDKGTSEYERQKSEMLTQYVQEQINIEINKKLVQTGLLDIQPQSEEEAQQIQQQIEGIRSAMTPSDIESYMKTSFRTAAEIWGENRLAANVQRFNLREKDRREFEDMLVASRCFRHYYLTSTGYDIETWNPIHTFFHKSPEVEHVENGDYVGRQFPLTLPSIIDKYGHLMTEEDHERLTDDYKKDKTRWNEAAGTNYVYDNYMTPFNGYPAYQAFRNIFPETNSEIPYFDTGALNSLTDNNLFTTNRGFYAVTEAYWKSQEKIHLVTFIDPETGLLVKKLLDEHAIIPKEFKKVETLFSDEQEPYTVTSTYVNRVWKGIKINLGDREKSLYLKVQPLEFQFKGDANIYGAKLPVCGQIFNVRNSEPMSLVDLMKPHQIGHNVAMNQLYQFMEKEVGAFVLFDVNMFPNSKDWGGEDSWGKWMNVAKSLGMVPIDTSPQNMNGSASAAGGQFPKVIDLNLGAVMLSRMNIAKFFEEKALSQIGFNQYRTGDFAASTTASGVQQGQSKSYAQTDTYFTQFSNYLRRCNRMMLDIAQYVEANNKDTTISYIKNDLTNGFIKTLGTDLLLADLYIFISNSQEQLRQLESIRQLGLTNNTAGASMADLAEIMVTNSPQNILRILKEGAAKDDAFKQQQQQLMQQKMEQDKAIADTKEAKLDERLDKEIAKDLKIAEINASSKIFFNKNYDPSEEDINNAQSNIDNANLDLKQQQFDHKKQMDGQSLATDRDLKLQKLALENKKIDAQIAKEKQDLEYVKILKS